MQSIGQKIRSLRAAKRVTQQTLAEAIGVGAQSVSKWETEVSVPDITLLPMLARYFGITMDELFGYRPDALSEKQRIVRLMADRGMLRFGSFRLQSGRVSPYYVSSSDTRHASDLLKMGAFFARAVWEYAPGVSVLAVRSDADLPVAVACGMILYEKYGVESEALTLPQLSARTECPSCVLLCDTLTSGETLRGALREMRQDAQVNTLGVIVSVDRMERGCHPTLSARSEIERETGVKIIPLVGYADIVEAIKQGVISGDADAMEAYAAQYGEVLL
jgi:orotate phosphoribosyltransferase